VKVFVAKQAQTLELVKKAVAGRAYNPDVEEVHEPLQLLRDCPDVLHIYSFMYHFGHFFNIEHVQVPTLELQYQDPNSIIVSDIHSKILRHLLNREDIRFTTWETVFKGEITRRNVEGDDSEATNLLDTPYADLDTPDRVLLTKILIDWSLDTSDDFRKWLNNPQNVDLSLLRLEPIGRDANRCVYWHPCPNRVYRETLSWAAGGNTTSSKWSVVCITIEEWLAFTRSFAKSTNANEKKLHIVLADELLPVVIANLQKAELVEFKAEQVIRLPTAKEQAQRDKKVTRSTFQNEDQKRTEYMEQESAVFLRLKKEEFTKMKRLEKEDADALNAAQRAEEDAIRYAADTLAKKQKRERDKGVQKELRQKERQAVLDAAAKAEHDKIVELEIKRQRRYNERLARTEGWEVPPDDSLADTVNLDVVRPRISTATGKRKGKKTAMDVLMSPASNIATDDDGDGDGDRDRSKGEKAAKNPINLRKMTRKGNRVYNSNMANAAARAFKGGGIGSMHVWHEEFMESIKTERTSQPRKRKNSEAGPAEIVTVNAGKKVKTAEKDVYETDLSGKPSFIIREEIGKDPEKKKERKSSAKKPAPASKKGKEKPALAPGEVRQKRKYVRKVKPADPLSIESVTAELMASTGANQTRKSSSGNQSGSNWQGGASLLPPAMDNDALLIGSGALAGVASGQQGGGKRGAHLQLNQQRGHEQALQQYQQQVRQQQVLQQQLRQQQQQQQQQLQQRQQQQQSQPTQNPTQHQLQQLNAMATLLERQIHANQQQAQQAGGHQSYQQPGQPTTKQAIEMLRQLKQRQVQLMQRAQQEQLQQQQQQQQQPQGIGDQQQHMVRCSVVF
jgi:hypothetical protein